MNKLEYMLWAINNNKQLERAWLLSTFGILPPKTNVKDLDTIGIRTTNEHSDGGHSRLYVKLNKQINGQDVIEIKEYVPGQPLFDRNEVIHLKANDLKCIKHDITTTYGVLIINSILIEYPYQGLVTYLNQELTPKLLNQTAYDMLKSSIGTVAMHIKFENGVSAITALSQTAVPSATRRSVTPNPMIDIVKPELLKEYAGRLHDPASVAELQDKIAKLDVDYLKGDPAERFYIKNKSKMSRGRTNAMFGAEQDFVDESKIAVMTNSLREGWTVKDIPMMANAIRGGSFNRGSNTALGGYETKVVGRIFQNYTIVKNDCQTKNGLHIGIHADNYKNFNGRYLVAAETPLTVDILKGYIGKTIHLRSAAYCQASGTTYCYKCMGDNTTNAGVGITAQMTTITSSFLSVFLALVHTQALSTKKYNYLERIS